MPFSYGSSQYLWWPLGERYFQDVDASKFRYSLCLNFDVKGKRSPKIFFANFTSICYPMMNKPILSNFHRLFHWKKLEKLLKTVRFTSRVITCNHENTKNYDVSYAYSYMKHLNDLYKITLKKVIRGFRNQQN